MDGQRVIVLWVGKTVSNGRTVEFMVDGTKNSMKANFFQSHQFHKQTLSTFFKHRPFDGRSKTLWAGKTVWNGQAVEYIAGGAKNLTKANLFQSYQFHKKLLSTFFKQGLI